MPQLNPIDAKLVLLDRYETTQGIFNHSVEHNRVFPLMGFHPAEDPLLYSPIRDRLRAYRDNSIKDYWGLSLAEFLNLTRDIADLICEVSQEYIRKDNRAINNSLKDLPEL